MVHVATTYFWKPIQKSVQKYVIGGAGMGGIRQKREDAKGKGEQLGRE